MMRLLSPHNTATGGTTHGRCTVHRAAVPSDRVPGFHEPDAGRVSAAGPTLRDGVPMPDGGVADGWETPDCAPVYRVQNLPTPNPRGSVIVYSDVCQDLHAASSPGSLVPDSIGFSGKSQATDIIDLIVQLIRRQNGVHRSCRNRTSRG